MRLLVKLGGTLLDSVESRRRLAEELTAVAASGVELVVVHGGGRQMTRFLAERGVESHFVNGLRVTTPEVLDAVLKVFAGTVNHELVASFVAAGARSVGLSGIDAGLAEAEPMDPALGAVGRLVGSDGGVLRVLTANRFLPVVACVAGDREGRIYNVNADQMAAACARGFSADRLYFLTDVDGVRDSSGSVLHRLTIKESDRLIREGIATAGMQAKLTAVMEALRGGIGEVVIAGGGVAGITARLLSGNGDGTHCFLD